MKKLLKIGLVAGLLAFMFAGCDDMNGQNDPTVELTSDGKYISVDSDAKGIKITIEDGVTFKKDGGNSISVEGNPLKIIITNDDIIANRKEFIYPFAEKDKEYVLQVAGAVSVDGGLSYNYITEKVKCNAGGGLDYKQYLDPNPIKTSTLNVSFADEKFSGTLNFNNTEIIKDPSAFLSARIDYVVVLGELDWSHTAWWVGCSPAINLLAVVSKNNTFEGDSWKAAPSLGDWNQYNYKYGSYITPSFKFKDFADTSFEMDAVWSSQKTYVPATKILTEAEAFDNCVKNVKTFINSEESLKLAIADSVAEYEVFFKSGSNSRSATTGGDASDQIKKFILALYQQYVELMQSFESAGETIPDFKVDFDKTIDIGKLGAKEWKSAIVDIAKYVASLSGNEYAGNKIEGEINNYIWESRIDLGLNTENDFYDFIDSVIDFQKLYFNAKADVDFSAAKLQDEKSMSESIGSVALDANFKVVALDVNKIIATSAGIQSVDLPVKTISLDVSGNLAAAATYANVVSIMTAMNSSSDSTSVPDFSDLKYNLGYKTNIKTALCTKNGLGGIVGIDATYDLDIETILALSQSAKYMSEEQALNLLDDVVTLKVYVSNGSKNTFSKDYKLSDLYVLIMEIAE